MDITEVSKSVRNPNGVTYVDGIVFVADTGNERLAYKAVVPSVFIEPAKMKIDDLRVQLQERNITVKADARKKELVKALTKWIQKERKEIKYSASDLNKLPPNTEIRSPLAVAAAARDMLMVTDSHSHSVFQVNVNNNGACLRGTVTLLMKLQSPLGWPSMAFNLYVSDWSDDGGITRFHMATSQRVMIVKNGTPLCQTVHDVDVTKDGHVLFTDRGSRIVRTLSQEGSHTEITVLAGSDADASKDGSHLAASFCQPTSLCVKGKTVFVTDSAVGAVKMVTPPLLYANF